MRWNEIPALPVTAFKEAEVTSLPAHERSTVFHSSGTTGQKPSRHFHNADSLRLYEASLLPPFREHLLGDQPGAATDDSRKPPDRIRFVILTPPPELAPHSSLVHMFERTRRDLGGRGSMFVGMLDETGAWALDANLALKVLRDSSEANQPVALLGTAFSFVHLLDYLAAGGVHLRLAEDSRVMETGGYKGRSRTIPKPELHALITQQLGVPASHIVCEYGMSELSSQAYDQHIGSSAQPQRLFRFPPWARVQVVSPETGLALPDGELGWIRILDLANIRSVSAIQTEDLGIARDGGFELAGRAELAESRGCSLMAV